LAEKERVNVGLACADREEMVYLESIRYNRRVALRNVVSGQRVPMELTSLGRAYLATTTARQRKSLEATFQRRNGPHWVQLKQALEEAIDSVQTNGYCAASWQPEVVAVSTPLMSPDGVFALNMSVSTQDDAKQVTRQLAPKLLALKKIITRDIARLHV
jgi:DNA-binding IclR family transcriptional regulator